MNVLQLYWDMDGVLADFDAAKLRALAGEEIHHTNDNADALSPEGRAQKRKMTGIIAQDPYSFFLNLPAFSDMLDLVERTAEVHGRFSILTATPGRLSPQGRDEDRQGKRHWLNRHLPSHRLSLWFDPTGERESKGAYVGRYNPERPQVLVDDRESNCRDWSTAGGIAVLHTSTVKTLRALDELRSTRIINC